MNSQPNLSTPSLSVVVVILGGPDYLDRCLHGLLVQSQVQDVEIIVPCDERVSELSDLRKKFPSVSFLPARGRRTFAELRALGVCRARGAVIALTEDHCTPDPDWCDRILRAHGAPYAAVGGAVEKTAPDTAVNWALYLADYGRYMNPKAKGLSSELTDCNVSYKRAALLSIAGVWQPEFHEPAVHAALRAHGEALWFSPDIIVRQQRSLSLRDAMRDRYAFGRLFGAGRLFAPCSMFSAASFRRMVYAGCAIFLPPILVGRIAKHVFGRRRHVGIFFRSLPALIVLNSAWTWGEFVGYLTSRPGTSLKPRSNYTAGESLG